MSCAASVLAQSRQAARPSPRIKEVVRTKRLDDRVRFHGHVDDETKRVLLSQPWLAATASSAEGWSLSTLEAASSGTPTVAHPVGGLNESIVDGQTGLHAETVVDCVAAVQKVVGDEDLGMRLSVKARARAETLGWDRSAAGTLEVLKRAAFGDPPPAREQRAAPSPTPSPTPSGKRDLGQGVLSRRENRRDANPLLAGRCAAPEFGGDLPRSSGNDHPQAIGVVRKIDNQKWQFT